MKAELPEDQAALWNGAAGQAWVEGQDLLDRLFLPFEQRLVEGAVAQEASDVLDIGCGTGSTTVAIACALGTGRRCTGIDISAPMIEAARARAARERIAADFLVADAGSHGFDPGRFDRIVSRFGVMFFADPIAAFANLRGSARPGAALDLIVWRSAEENPFMTTAERAAAPLLPALPPRKAGAPGQFAFADPDHVRAILERGGWSGIAMERLDIACVLPEAALVRYFTSFGPLGRVIDQIDGAQRERLIATVRAAFDRYVEGSTVRFDAACWSVRAWAA